MLGKCIKYTNKSIWINKVVVCKLNCGTLEISQVVISHLEDKPSFKEPGQLFLLSEMQF